MRQKEANQTALLAIGPRKKRKTESADQGQGVWNFSIPVQLRLVILLENEL